MLRLTLVGLAAVAAALASPPVPFHFVPNTGGFSPEVHYLAPVRRATVLLTDTGLAVESRGRIPVDFEGASPSSQWTPASSPSGTTTYRIGNDERLWLNAVPHYTRVERRGVYPGIDVVAYGAEGRFEYDFVIGPEADPGRIRLRFDRRLRLRLRPNGDLEARRGDAEILQRRPAVYQRARDGSRRRIDGSYRLLRGNRVEFVVAAYDRSRPLTIDPVLESATLLGGSGDERIVLADPNNVVVGSTASVDIPGQPVGARKGSDIFVYFPRTQSTIVFGGSGDDIVTSASAAGDLNGSVSIGGYTDSRDLPTKSNSSFIITPQARYGGGEHDGFLILLASYGSPQLLTYFGGSGDDRILAVHSTGFYDLLAFGGSTTSPDLPLMQPWQKTPGRGVDGFVGGINMTTTSASSPLVFASYFGGDGDDQVLAVAAPSSTELYAAGETRSAVGSLPFHSWTGARQGPSDAFLLRSRRILPYYHPFLIENGALWGGSGEDRASQIRISANGRLAAAGVTGSPDFAAGGISLPGLQGATDVFVATAAADLSTVSFARLLGGSGDDEPLALATDSFNDILVGGWTNSSDFPLQDAFQQTFGGGGSDGFLAHLDSGGRLLWSSYYGGSAADRVSAVGFEKSEKGGRLFFGGSTESLDLPVRKPLQSANAGAADAFYGALVVPLIRADGVTGGKDLAGRGYAALGDAATAVGVPLTVTSPDPASVLLAARGDEEGRASIVITARGAGNDLAGRAFLVYCLTDSGVFDLKLSAPGYPDRAVPARCVPSALTANKTEVAVPTSGSGSGSGFFTVSTVAVDPDNGRPLAAQNPRGGLTIRVDAASADAATVTLTNSTAEIGPFTAIQSTSSYQNSAAIAFTTSAIGSADVVLTTAAPFRFAPSDRVRVRVTGPALSLYVPPMARDFVDRMAVSITPALPSPVEITLSTSDSSKIRITNTFYAAGTAVYTLPCNNWCNEIFAEALGEGPVSITASGPGLEPVTVPVAIMDPVARLFDSQYNQFPGEFSYPAAGRLGYSVYLTAGGVVSSSTSSSLTPALRQGAAPIDVRLTTSDPAIASVPESTQRITPPGRLVAGPFAVTAQAGGQAVLSAAFSSTEMRPKAQPVTLAVYPAGISIASATIGRNLQIGLPMTVPGSAEPRTVTVASSDPSRLVLSDDPTRPGQGSITFAYRGQLYAQALADSGDVPVTVSSPGLGEATATVHLVPAGVAWTSESMKITTAEIPGKGDITPPSLSAYALDPATLAPLAAEAVRPGVEPVSLELSNPEVAALPATSIQLASSPNGYPATAIPVEIAPKTAGEAKVAIRQPAGFLTPAGRGPLRLTVGQPVFYLGSPAIGRNLQATITATFPRYPADTKSLPPMTIVSTDPSRLLLSATESDAGAGSATVKMPFDGFPPSGTPYQPVYAQGIDGPADVRVTASIPGYEDVSVAIPVVPTALAFPTDGPALNPTRITNLQSPLSLAIYPVPLDGGSLYVGYSNRATLRAGFPATPVPIASSNPAVARVEKDPVLNARTDSAGFTVTPLSPGETELTIVPPPGFVLMPSGQGQKLKIVVEGATIEVAETALARDLVVPAPLVIRNGPQKPTADVDVVVTSDDPSKVLVSASPTAPGAASASIRIQANQTGASKVYLHGLDDRGSVPIRVSAPGYGSRTNNATLSRLQFATDSGSMSVGLQQSATLTLGPIPAARSFYGESYQIRPGASPFPLTVTSRDRSIVTVTPESTVVQPGTSRVEVKVQGVGPGETMLTVGVPPAYDGPQPVSVSVRDNPLQLYGSSVVGKDLQALFTVTRATVTVTSSDPSRVVVSASPTAAGQASVTATDGQVYAQALSDTGTVTLTATAAGYQTATATIALAPGAVVFGSTNTTILSTLSPPLRLEAVLTTLGNSGALTRRGGAAPLAVPITLSDPAVGTVSPAELVFRPGEGTASFLFQPRAAGSELISLAVPDGFADPLTRRHLLLTVNAARLILNGTLAVGKDLQTQVSAALSGATGQTTISLASNEPSRLTVGLQRTGLGSAATLSFGTNVASIPVYLAGLSSSGSATLTAAGDGLAPSTYPVTLQPSGFRFGASSTTVAAGGSTTVQIYSSMLSSPGLTPAGDLPVRGDLPAAIPLTVTSSNSAVVSVSAAPLYFYPGDSQQRLTITGKASGIATLTLTPPEGWSIPAGANRMTVIVP